MFLRHVWWRSLMLNHSKNYCFGGTILGLLGHSRRDLEKWKVLAASTNPSCSSEDFFTVCSDRVVDSHSRSVSSVPIDDIYIQTHPAGSWLSLGRQQLLGCNSLTFTAKP